MIPYKPSEEVLTKLKNLVDVDHFEINKDHARRDHLLGVSVPWDELSNDPQHSRVQIRFENLTVNQLEILILENFVITSYQINNQPSVSDSFHFMSKWPAIRASGNVDILIGIRPYYSFRIDEFHVYA